MIDAPYPAPPCLVNRIAMQLFPPRWLFILLILPCLFHADRTSSAKAENWPQWRGPRGDGTSLETNLPLQWSTTSGIAWQCPVPGWGDSTPAVWGDAVFVTTQVDNQSLQLLRLDIKTGQIIWQRQVGEGKCPHEQLHLKENDQRRHQSFHESHNYASPSPVTDGRAVVVHFGNGDLAAYDFEGKQLWKRNLQKDYGEYTVWWGHANSPVLYGDLVISICVQDSCGDLPGKPSPSYVVAHDLKTGKERWKTMRMTSTNLEPCDSYTTPILWKDNGRLELVVLGSLLVDAYDPATGKRLWHMPDLIGNRTITGPVASENLLFVTQGMRQPLLAIRSGGEGKRTQADVAWQFSQGTPDSATPVIWEKSLFFVANDGIARCLDLSTGKEQWKQRLKGEYRASPVAADGRIYFLNTQGLATVTAASPKFRRLAENSLDDETLASPAVSDGRILIRGRKALYSLGK
jgi:outer membrane protein assembly factor BamB